VTNFRFDAACAEAGAISGPNRAYIPSQAVFGSKGMKTKQENIRARIEWFLPFHPNLLRNKSTS
jgi:hypothetical protein